MWVFMVVVNQRVFVNLFSDMYYYTIRLSHVSHRSCTLDREKVSRRITELIRITAETD